MKEGLTKLGVRQDVINAILKEKWTDTHMHLERIICHERNLPLIIDHVYFTPGFFYYVNILDRPQHAFFGDYFMNALDKVLF